MLITTLLAMALPALSLAAKVLPADTITQIAEGTWIESLAVRPNGALLATLLVGGPDIITVTDPASHHPSTSLLTSIPSLKRIAGISEIPTSDHVETYLVVGDDIEGVSTAIGHASAWTIKFPKHKHGKPVVAKVADLEGGQFLNGVTSIPGVLNTALIADSEAGSIIRLNLETGEYDSSAFVYPELLPADGAAIPLGVNGLKIYEDHLYFSNTFLVCIYRIPITPAGYPSAAPEQVANVTSIGAILDDFTFDARGNIYAATNFDNKVVYLDLETGVNTIVVGGLLEMTVAGDTAMAFGRGQFDQHILYVTTGGAMGAPVGGNRTEGAKIVAVDTSPC